MKLVVVAVRDRKVEAFRTPAFVAHIGAAVRGFTDAANSKENEIGKYPEDHELYELGTFDDFDAKFSLLEKPRLVAVAADLLRG